MMGKAQMMCKTLVMTYINFSNNLTSGIVDSIRNWQGSKERKHFHRLSSTDIRLFLPEVSLNLENI